MTQCLIVSDDYSITSEEPPSDADLDYDELEELELKISILAQEETGELGAEVIKGLQEIRDQKLREREEGATKIISNKREYIRHIFNRAINRIINQRLATVQVKIADLGNACFDVS